MAMRETIMNRHTSITNDRRRYRNRGNFSFGRQPTRHSHLPYSNAWRMYWQPNHQQNHPSSFPPFPHGQFGRWEQPWDQQIPQWDYQCQPQPGHYMSRGSYATNPGHGYNKNQGRGGTYHGNMQPYNYTSTNTSQQGVYFADASGIVHTEAEPLQDNAYCNHDFDTSKLFFSDPYSNTEENYDDNPITPDQKNEYDTIGYEEVYGCLNKQHPDQCS